MASLKTIKNTREDGADLIELLSSFSFDGFDLEVYRTDKPYKVGDTVIIQNNSSKKYEIFKCIRDTSGSFDNTKWVKENIFREMNEVHDIQDEARAKLYRDMTHSGVLSVGTPNISTNWDSLRNTGSIITEGDYFKKYPNSFGAGSFTAIVNGYSLSVFGGNRDTSNDERVLIAELPEPPTFGYRDDLVFLEAWFEKNETSRRVELNWRRRTVAGADFSKGESSVVKDGTATTSVDWDKTLQPFSATGEPIAYNPANPTISGYVTATSTYAVGNKNLGNKSLIKDSGLWVAGDGTQASKNLLKTVDGYMYAIPLFRVKRRNNGKYREDNLNGAREYFKSSYSQFYTSRTGRIDYVKGSEYTFTTNMSADDLSKFSKGDLMVTAQNYVYFIVKSVDISNKKLVTECATTWTDYTAEFWEGHIETISDRPDGKFANIIHKDDIIDLRHRVYLTGVNYSQLLEETKDKLLRGELFTKDKPGMIKESFGLEPAPLGLESMLMPTKVLGNDGIERLLVNSIGNYKESSHANSSSVIVNKDYIEYTASVSNTRFGFNKTLGWDVVNKQNHYIIHAKVPSMTGNSKIYQVWICKAEDYVSVKRVEKTKANGLGFISMKISPEDLAQLTGSGIRILVTADDGVQAGDKIQVSEVSMYEVDKATYDLINVDPNFTGVELTKKFPYVSSYPNVVSNPISLKELFDSGFTITDTTGAEQQNHGVTVSMEGNNLVISNTAPYNRIVRFKKELLYKNVPASQINLYNPNGGKHTSLELTRTDGNGFLYIQIGSANSGVSKFTLYTITINQNLPVPYGRWFLPSDYANGDTPLRLPDFQGALQRRKWSDAQSSESVTDIIDPISNSHLPHISVYQRTAGQWTVGDTLTIKSNEGFVMGALDNDTALVNVVEIATSALNGNTNQGGTIKVSDVSKISVNDRLQFVHMVDNKAYQTMTVTAVDTANNVITVTMDTPAPWSMPVGSLLIEITASTSSPVVTATGLVGNWTGLGTKEATFTITTAPTTNTTQIKVDYACVYPAGKGLGNLPAESLEATVNGQRLVKATDNIVRIKSNFVDKTQSNNDLNPNVYKYANNLSTLMQPNGGVEVGTSSYLAISSLDGVTTKPGDGDATKVSGVMHQQMYGFNIIRILEDKLGDGFFADCLTLADKIAKAKTTINTIRFNWWGFGSNPTGNSAKLRWWKTADNSWQGSPAHTNGVITKLTNNLSGPDVNAQGHLDSNGFVHYLVYAEASDGTTPSVIITDYVELELEINVAESGYDVLVPENPFPVLPKNLLTQNISMPVDLSKWTPGSNTNVNMVSPGVVEVQARNNAYANVDVSTGVRRDVGKLYTYSFEMKGIGNNRKSTVELPYSDKAYYDFDITGDWKRYVVVVTQLSQADSRLNFYAGKRGSVEAGNTVHVRNLKVTEGIDDGKFTGARKKTLLFNYLGKVPGNTLDNPHKSFGGQNSSFVNPSVFSAESSTSGYSDIATLNGGLSRQESTTAGLYIMRLFEFDLSHLGMSLAELKIALRKMTIRWTGYGKGGEGSVGYGATLRVWNGEFSDAPNQWSNNSADLNTENVPSLITKALNKNVDVIKYLTKEQKVYVLVHSTYPASASISAELYTDYVSLEVEMADYVDYIKGNVVKVQKETKEIKLQYPKKSYRTGKEDVINLWYRSVPYQGVGKGRGKIVYMDNNFTVLTMGTGKYDSSLSSVYNNASSRLPKTSGSYKDHYLLLDPLIPIFGIADTRIMKFPVNIGTRSTGLTSVYYPEGEDGNTMYSKELLYANMSHLTVLAYLVVVNGEIRLKIKSSFSTNNVVSNAGTTEIDDFLIEGRPLIKGVN